MKKTVFSIIVLSVLFHACNPYFKNTEEDNSPTSGILKVYTDTSIAPVVRIFARTFESQYPNATVTVIPDCKENLIRMLHEEKAKVVVLPDSMEPGEIQAFSKDKHYLNSTRLCFSSVSFLSPAQGTPVFSDLKTLDSLMQNPNVVLYMPPSCSDVPLYVFNKILKGKPYRCKVNFIPPDSIPLYVQSGNDKTIGIVEHSAVSDLDDPKVKTLLKSVRILAIKKSGTDSAFYPDPTNFELRNYPLTRAWHYYRNAPEFSLAKGFENFMAGEQGQRLFLKYGLLPSTKPERNIKVTFEKTP
jgi:hypothetical protein